MAALLTVCASQRAMAAPDAAKDVTPKAGVATGTAGKPNALKGKAPSTTKDGLPKLFFAGLALSDKNSEIFERLSDDPKGNAPQWFLSLVTSTAGSLGDSAKTGVIDLSPSQDPYFERIPIEGSGTTYNIYILAYSVTPGDEENYGKWKPVTNADSGLSDVSIVGRNKYKATIDPSANFVGFYLSTLNGIRDEDPGAYLTLSYSYNRNENFTYASGSGKGVGTVNYIFKPGLAWSFYGIGGTDKGLWIPLGTFDLHQDETGKLSLAPAPIGLAWGIKKYFGGSYIGASDFVSFGSQSVTDLFSNAGGSTFSFIDYGVLFDLDNYMYIGFGIERDFNIPNSSRGAAVIALGPGLLNLLKSGTK
jgi:hypothetical protein